MMTAFYDEDTGRYIIKNARILFPNFAGEEQDYNPAGKRNFRLVVDEALANELQDRGLHVRTREPLNEGDEAQYFVKIGVYRDADIRLLSGRVMTALEIDDFDVVDKEFRRGHVKNREIGLEFHVSVNTKVRNGSPYARLDTAVVPIGRSRLLEEYDCDDPIED